MTAPDLVDIDLPLTEALERGEDLQPGWRLSAGEDRTLAAEVARQTVEYLRSVGAQPPWTGYFAVDPATRKVVGTCSYKGNPGAERAVEIAYFTFPRFEGRGWATAMAHALVERAFAAGAGRVIAHTLPLQSASTRILGKLGFSFAGPVEDPVEGTLWRWQRSRATG